MSDIPWPKFISPAFALRRYRWYRQTVVGELGDPE